MSAIIAASVAPVSAIIAACAAAIDDVKAVSDAPVSSIIEALTLSKSASNSLSLLKIVLSVISASTGVEIRLEANTPDDFNAS